MKRVPAFDGLRAVAISMVIICHVCARSPQLVLTHLVGQQGWYGVDIFFVLSGFLITRLLIAKQQATGGVNLRRFYVRRIFRLYPALISAVGLTLLGLLVMRLHRDIKTLFLFLPLILTYTFNWWISFFGVPPGFQLDQIWPLCVEEHFYLLWPAAFKRLRPGHAFFALAAGLTIALLVRAIAVSFRTTTFAGNFIAYSTLTRMDAIIVGCGMALLVPWLESYPFLYTGRALWLYTVVTLVLIECGAKSQAFCAAGGSTIMATAVGATVTAIWLGAQCGVSRLLSSPLPVEIGKVSHGIYLFHLAVLAAVLRILHIYDARSSMLAIAIFSLTFLVTLAFSELHYRVVESRFLVMRDHLFRRHTSNSDMLVPLMSGAVTPTTGA